MYYDDALYKFTRQSAKIHIVCVQSERVVNCWNSLPDSVDFSSSTTLSTFRRTVKQVDFTRFLRL